MNVTFVTFHTASSIHNIVEEKLTLETMSFVGRAQQTSPEVEHTD